MTDHKIGAQMYTVRDSIQDLEGFVTSLQKLRAIGYRAVQVSGLGADVDFNDAGKALQDTEMICAATHVGWDGLLNDIDTEIAKHKAWNCKHVAIGGLWGDEYQGAEGLKKFLDELPAVTEALAKEGMTFSYHNHNHEFARFDGKVWLESLYEQAPDLNAELDVFWVQAGGADPVEWINKLAGRQPAIHFKDMAIKAPNEQIFAEVGEGNMNWQAIIEAAKKANVSWYFVEQDNCYGVDPFECLAISYRNLHSWGLS